jgi:hypothetical protein
LPATHSGELAKSPQDEYEKMDKHREDEEWNMLSKEEQVELSLERTLVGVHFCTCELAVKTSLEPILV